MRQVVKCGMCHDELSGKQLAEGFAMLLWRRSVGGYNGRDVDPQIMVVCKKDGRLGCQDKYDRYIAGRGFHTLSIEASWSTECWLEIAPMYKMDKYQSEKISRIEKQIRTLIKEHIVAAEEP